MQFVPMSHLVDAIFILLFFLVTFTGIWLGIGPSPHLGKPVRH
jgi:hypothetical protein